MSLRTGVWLYPDAPVDELVAAVVELDAAGVDEVWIADEGVMRDPVVVFAAAARRTSHIRMGIGITSPALRHPGAIASTVASLDELSTGRMMLGLGVGGEQSLGPFGLRVERPVALVRDALRVARAVLSRTDADGYVVTEHALYQSVRFTTSAAGDPTSVTGEPAEIARVLRSLVERHRPDTIGLALVDGAAVLDVLAPAIDALRRLR